MADGRFTGQVVLITGAASGFGAEAARRFAAEGARLVLSDLDPIADPPIDVLDHPADVSDADQMAALHEAALDRFGQIDVAINNAGIGHDLAPLTDIPVEAFDRMMAVNARGVFLGMKHQLPGMIARKSGVILNVSSAAGLLGASHLSAYAASKHAVVGLTRAAADEVARAGVRVNAVCPSFAATPLFNEMADDIATKRGMDRETAYTHIAARIPMRRVARVEEVVQAMVWACDPANSFMTGQTISIDGGLTAV
ncbi:SDR family NAD(P)-dependent oxidoreductase [Actibacterium sp. 188UL27-1]|uniref:SDR family NAD(P)-dependent oxidoreductase n=1 Tax=Actibacterium sp. 188UL27-1 TaxID=2786961 RepID=UPI0019597229|nr:SDR family oxidoreductase [Actibacterium sp. 188UL27-1]MBM7069640.1 SDR family oxidoreductase [Actibacterium sp. 188UL27-1]